MKNIFSLLVLLATLSACVTTTQLNNKGSEVRLGQSDPDKACKELGHVDSRDAKTWPDLADKEPIGAKNNLRNQAAAMGANYVRLESLTPLSGEYGTYGYRASGTAFSCPQ